MDKTGRVIARIVGGVSLAFGIIAAILGVWAIDRQFAIRGIVQVSAAAVIVIFLSIGATRLQHFARSLGLRCARLR